MSALAILLPAGGDDPARWLLVEDERIVARGEGDGWPRDDDPGAATRAVLIAPAVAVSLHRAVLPELADRQAAAAARLMAVENALGAADTLHIATGARDGDGAMDVAVVANADMADWLGWAGHHALDVTALIPAALLLPRPEEGFVRARIGDETVARDPATAFAIDDAVADLVIGDAPVIDLTVTEIEAALVASLALPPLDLRQGVFARRQRRAIDWGLVRRAGVLVGVILLLSLIIALVRIAKLDNDTERLDAEALTAARTVIPGAASAAAAESALDARASTLGVGGRGFGGSAARLFAALDQSPAVALTALDVARDGTIRATLAGPTANDLDVAVAALRGSGAGATTTPVQSADGRQSVQLTVAPR
ncbi:MAG: type II secretion system protein GspL [Pseudomonadota bacterium]